MPSTTPPRQNITLAALTLAALKEILKSIPNSQEQIPRTPMSRRPSFDLTLETVYENEPLVLSND